MELFDKLDNVKLSNLDKLTGVDRIEIGRLNDYYLSKLAYLQEIEKGLQDLHERVAKIEYLGKTENHYTNPFHYTNYDLHENVKKSSEKVGKLTADFIDKVFGYFQRKYSLSLEQRVNKEVTIETILACIFAQVNVSNFEGAGVEELRRVYRDFLKHQPTLSGTTIKFPSLLYLSKYSWDIKYDVSDSARTRVNTLLKLICKFENNYLCGNLFNDYSVYISEPFTTGFTKVHSFKIYQNGALSIMCNDKATANGLLEFLNK